MSPLEWSDRRGPPVRRAIGSVGRIISHAWLLLFFIHIYYRARPSLNNSQATLPLSTNVPLLDGFHTCILRALPIIPIIAPIRYQRDTLLQLPADTVHLSLVDLIHGNGRHRHRQHS